MFAADALFKNPASSVNKRGLAAPVLSKKVAPPLMPAKTAGLLVHAAKKRGVGRPRKTAFTTDAHEADAMLAIELVEVAKKEENERVAKADAWEKNLPPRVDHEDAHPPGSDAGDYHPVVEQGSTVLQKWSLKSEMDRVTRLAVFKEDWESIEKNGAWVTAVIVDHIIAKLNFSNAQESNCILGNIALEVALFPQFHSKTAMETFLRQNNPILIGESWKKVEILFLFLFFSFGVYFALTECLE